MKQRTSVTLGHMTLAREGYSVGTVAGGNGFARWARCGEKMA